MFSYISRAVPITLSSPAASRVPVPFTPGLLLPSPVLPSQQMGTYYPLEPNISVIDFHLMIIMKNFLDGTLRLALISVPFNSGM